MKIYVKNMVCDRCVIVVKHVLENLQIPYQKVLLGEIITQKQITKDQEQNLKHQLLKLGFEWIEDKKAQTVEKIKTTIIELIHHQKLQSNIKLSEILSQSLSQEYNQLSVIFSSVEKQTIEKYFIAQKIEKVKELLIYDELSLKEIATNMQYSSVSYLSNQFKKVTGKTPTQFKQEKINTRKFIDNI